ncbi:MAG: molybdopterin-dependent oxidoreductase [Acidobacteriota bacterium]|nr:molybdopterin-dependent oxidoreductase [Acidobacteriota bacterium]
MKTNEVSRRQFFANIGKSSLVVGFTLAAGEFQTGKAAPTVQNSSFAVDSWLAIADEGRIIVYSGKVELGTGVQTALTQIVAEELNVELPQIKFVQGDTSLTPGDKGYTAGSKTIQNEGPPLRLAAATAFQALLGLASKRLGVPTSELHARKGSIGIGPELHRAVSYGELVEGQQIQLTTNPSVTVKDPSSYAVVGKPLRRVDIPDKFNGRFTYMQDLVISGMLHGRIVRPTGRNVHFDSLDGPSEAALQSIPGFLQVVQQGNFVGVVATDEWAAITAAQTLKVNWTAFASLPFGPGAPSLATTLMDPANIYQTDKEDVAGDVNGAFASVGASAILEAQYFTPYHMHGAVAPSCAVANVAPAPDASGIQVTVWSGTQGVYPLQGAIAQLLDLPATAVHVIYVEAAGCYGHNGADDAAADAVLLSRATGRPVRVQWMRQEEHGWEPLGPAMVHNMKGALQTASLVAWEHVVYTPTHNSRPGNLAGNLLAGQDLGLLPSALPNTPTNQGTRNGPVNYNFPNKWYVANQIRIFPTGPLGPSGAPALAPLTSLLPRSSALRSLGGFSNSFANESFLDELASAAGIDPVSFRLQYIDDPRAIAVINAMVRKSGWTAQPMAPGSAGILNGRGISFIRYETVETYVAALVEVQVNTGTGAVAVARVVVAQDCGLIINPDGLQNQIEGNVLQGISRTLFEEVQFNANGVTSVLWANSAFNPDVAYPVINFKDVPAAVETVLIDQPTEPSWGAGEAAIGPIPGAIGNAIFNATGHRVRTLPLTPERVLAALA